MSMVWKTVIFALALLIGWAAATHKFPAQFYEPDGIEYVKDKRSNT